MALLVGSDGAKRTAFGRLSCPVGSIEQELSGGGFAHATVDQAFIHYLTQRSGTNIAKGWKAANSHVAPQIRLG